MLGFPEANGREIFMQAERGASLGAICSVTAAALVWSSSFAVTKQVLRETDPLVIGAIRFSLAAVVLAVFVRLRGRRGAGVGPVDAQQRWLIRLSGLLGITVYFILENYGVQLANAADASLIVATYPLMTMLVELLVHRRAMPRLRVLGVALAGLGAVLVVRNGADAGGTGRWVGDALLLLGGLVWGCYNVLTKHVGAARDAVVLTYRQTCAGALGFLVVAAPEFRHQRMPDGVTLALLAYLALACSVGGFLLYNQGLRQMPPSTAVNILNIAPVFGVLGAVVINGERVELVQVLGGAIIIVGVVLGLMERQTTTATAALPVSGAESDVLNDSRTGLAR